MSSALQRFLRVAPARPFWWEPAVLLIIGGLLFGRAVCDTPLFHDEVHGIRTSASFEAYFHGNWSNENFLPGYTAVTQTPMLSYLAGLGRRVFRVAPEPLWPYALHQSYAYNLQTGAVPTEALLRASRAPFGLLAAVTGALLFWFVASGFGHLSGWLFSALYLSSAFYRRTLVRISGESPLLFFIVLAALACAVAMLQLAPLIRRPSSFRNAAATCGVALGLALCSKINAVMAVPAAAVSLASAGRRARLNGSDRGRETRAGAAFVAVLAALTFTLTDPYLVPNPVVRFASMVSHRFERLRHQPEAWPEDALDGPVARLAFLARPLTHAFPTRGGWGYGAGALALALAGGWRIVGVASRWTLNDAGHPTAVVAVLWGLFLSVPMLTTPMGWERYLLFPSIAVHGAMAVGAAGALNKALLSTSEGEWNAGQ